ncbi:hypothetical protein BJ165DRAFT_1522766 [Panaeolus papilionaceus]|nr:hypothetical protein BJ165DRAFT_1522766 [Panaeolus papilionaceus]
MTGFFDERFQSYLHNSDILQNEEAFEFQSRLQRLVEQRRDIKKNINVLNITLNALQRTCDDLDGTIYSYRSLFSPIRRLPEDVLGEIFLHTLPSTRNAIPILSELPLLLTLVCKKWRSIAQSTPRLWSRLHIVLPYNRATDIEGDEECSQKRSYVALVKHLLYLSGGVPLFLSISSCTQGYDGHIGTSPETKELLLAVIKHSTRWSEVNLVCDAYAFLFMNDEMIKCSPELSMPALRCVRAVHMVDPSLFLSDTDRPSTLYPYSSLALRELSLNLCNIFETSSFLPKLKQSVNWRLLTRLSLHQYDCGPQWLLGILLQCEQLEAFLLDIIGPCHDDSIGSIRLPNLKSLSLQGRQDNMDGVCRCLQTPLLTQFTFYALQVGFSTDESPLSPPFRKFLAQCGNIQSLTLRSDRCGRNRLIDIFEAVPGITTLTVNNSNFPFSVFGAPCHYFGFPSSLEILLLQVNDDNLISEVAPRPPFLPNLRKLSFLALSISPGLTNAIISFCKSRLSPTSSINTENPDSLFPSLDYIKMTLERQQTTIDIGEALRQYAESIGRKVGGDLTLDITYPWGDELHMDFESAPRFSPRFGVDHSTERSWNNIDA